MEPEFPLQPFSTQPDPILTIAQRELAQHLEATEIGRIVQATEEILQSRTRIQTEIYAMGANIAFIDQLCYSRFRAALGDTALARKRASTLLIQWCKASLQMSRSSIWLYLRIYERFVADSRAISIFNLGELQLLVGQDVSDENIDEMIEAKEKNPNISRDDFRATLKRLRETRENLAAANVQLDLAKDELSQSLTAQREQEYETSRLREQLSEANANALAHKDALNDAQLNLSRANGNVSQLQMSVHNLTAECARLNEAVAASKARIEYRDVAVTADGSSQELAERTQELERKRAELADAEAQLESIRSEMSNLQHSNDAEAAAKAHLDELLASFEALIAKYSVAQLRVLLTDAPLHYRRVLESIAAQTERMHRDLTLALAQGAAK